MQLLLLHNRPMIPSFANTPLHLHCSSKLPSHIFLMFPSWRPLPCLLSWQQSSFHQGFEASKKGGGCLDTLLRTKREVVQVRDWAAYNTSSLQTDVQDSVELSKRAQVSKRLEKTANYFRQFGRLGFWSQLVCTVVSGVILAFALAITGKPTSQATFYLTAGGIATAFLSVFRSFGYLRLSDRLRNTIHDLAKAPSRTEVVKNLKNGIVLNLLGMGSTLLGMQATVGVLVAKALTSSAGPYLQASPGYSPVLALDVFLLQASANALLSHFLGLVFSLELLRSVTRSQRPSENAIPKPA